MKGPSTTRESWGRIYALIITLYGVVAHQAIGMHLPTGFLARFGQCLDEVLPIHVIDKNGLPPVSSAHDMIRGTGIFYP